VANLFVLPPFIDRGLIYINMSAVKLIGLTILLTLTLPALSADSLPAKFAKRDRNKDGKLSREEVPASFAKFKFAQADRNKDGFLDKTEIERVAQKLSAKENSNPSGPINPVIPKANTIRIFRDIVYRKDPKDTKGWNKLDLYLPKIKGFSTLLWIHGGGLHSGDKSKITEVAKRFVAEGYGVASVNYRLYPDAKYPTQIQDVARAFAWVHNNIVSKGGDPNLIFVAGGSAGGHLTALLATNHSFLKEHGIESTAIRGTIPISGLMDVSRVGVERRKGIWGEDPKIYRTASPLHHASKTAPPLLLLYAEHDTPDRKKQNQEMYDALIRAKHGNVEIHELKNRTHNDIRPHLAGRKDPGSLLILAFLKKHSADKGSLPKKQK